MEKHRSKQVAIKVKKKKKLKSYKRKHQRKTDVTNIIESWGILSETELLALANEHA